MPRSKMNASHVSKLMTEMTTSTILKHIPLSMVSRHLHELDLESKRHRMLPAESIVYLIILMALYAEVSIIENLRSMLDPIRRMLGISNSKVPVGSAIVKARKKLGYKVFKDIFEDLAHPVATPETKDCFWKGYRVVAVDGTSQPVQDTEDNRKFFEARHISGTEASNPELKAVTLMECGTKMFFAVATGTYKVHEQTLYHQIVDKQTKDMIVLADRAYFGVDLWMKSARTAGALVWRVRCNLKLAPKKTFKDGSFLSEIKPDPSTIKKKPYLKDVKITVRVIQFKPVFSDKTEGEEVRLITTILDPAVASAEEIAKLYPSRWLIEEGYGELKYYLGRHDRLLRSQSPELVIQEFYGFLLAHRVARLMIWQSAERNDLAPNDLSYINSLRIIKRKLSFFPSGKRNKGL